jgi:hypothetical protein
METVMKSKMKIIMIGILLFSLFPVFGYSMKVSFFLGSSTLTRNGKTVKLQMGDIVSNGDIIKTAKNSVVELLYDDSSKITIKGDTIVQIGSRNINDSGNVAVISGEVNGKFVKLKKGAHKLGTPTTICAVRGTEFTMGVSKGGDSRIELTEGKLDVRNPYGKVELNEGYSVEADVAGEPVSGENEGNIEEWQNARDESLNDNIEAQARKYETHINNFGEESGKSAKELEELSESTKKAATKEDLALSGEKIINSESKIEENILMNEASKSSIENLMEDYSDKNAKIKDKFQSLAKKCNKVQEEQLKNYQAVQKVKEEYKKAYDNIMKKFKDDKTKIFKNLEDYKKTSPLHKEESKEEMKEE